MSQAPFKLHPATVNRLTKLADFLAALPGRSFDISSWTDNNAFYGDTPEELASGTHFKAGVSPKVAIDCGTTCCAAGWGATIPSFVRAGFKLRAINSGLGQYSGFVEYKGKSGFDACELFFRISGDVAMHFFSGGEYDYSRKVTPYDVATRIRSFVKNPVAHAKRWNLDLVN